MFSSKLIAIYTTDRKGQPLDEVEQAELVVGEGLVGDRFSKTIRRRAPKPLQEVTLIESEAIHAVSRDCGIELSPAECRRNLLTIIVPLNHLVGREFEIGSDVVLRGIELCEPCGHLEKTDRQEVDESAGPPWWAAGTDCARWPSEQRRRN